MGASAAAGLQAVVARPCIISPTRMFTSRTTISGFNLKVAKQGLTNSSVIFSRQSLCEIYPSSSSKYCRVVTRAMSGETEKETAYGLPIDLRGTGFIIIAKWFTYGDLQTFLLFSQEVAESVKNDFGSIDILVHSLANGPEVFFLQFVCVCVLTGSVVYVDNGLNTMGLAVDSATLAT
ncbi:hypothetical protein B296_00044101 [Ensete ventricosum]|uniref:Uncharacterized protein n=1 Tax=Ensete ventricosum TaxID=4639 RepID=A0A426Z969_ENSVE|nr:hypothetical protein B296_00044101 [Ensete ventricosum]